MEREGWFGLVGLGRGSGGAVVPLPNPALLPPSLPRVVATQVFIRGYMVIIIMIDFVGGDLYIYI